MINRFNMLAIKSANQTLADAALLPDPIFLYAPLIVQGEITILFADTGIGKTVLSVMIAIYIAKKYKLLYVDLELTDKQFEKRYRNEDGKHFNFPANFFRATYEILKELPNDISYEEFFIKSLKDCIKEFSAEVVVLDNLTKICSSTDSAKSTIPIMNALSALKFEEGITFLVLRVFVDVHTGSSVYVCLRVRFGNNVDLVFPQSRFFVVQVLDIDRMMPHFGNAYGILQRAVCVMELNVSLFFLKREGWHDHHKRIYRI